MRIVEILSINPPEVFFQRHIRAIAQPDIDLVVVALDKDNRKSNQPASIQAPDLSLQVTQAPVYSNMRLPDKFWAARFLVLPHQKIIGDLREKILASFLERLKPDLIHFSTAYIAQQLFSIPYQLNLPYSVSLRGSDVQVVPLVNPELTSDYKKALEASSGVHSVSDAIWSVAKENFQICGDRVYQKTIYTTVPIIKPLKRPHKNGKIFIAVGRFHWTKAFINLLIAFRKYLDHDPTASLNLVGDGQEETSIIFWIKALKLERHVNLAGKLSYAEFSSLLQDSTAFIQSSVTEGLSNATAEAMASGCPVFATDVGGTGEVIKDNENGFLLDFSSPETWYKKLLLANNHDRMEEVRRAAWDTANHLFSPETHAKQFTNFFEKCIQHFQK
jgi:glycosyltransferase involved in cell wall biosynthesis